MIKLDRLKASCGFVILTLALGANGFAADTASNSQNLPDKHDVPVFSALLKQAADEGLIDLKSENNQRTDGYTKPLIVNKPEGRQEPKISATTQRIDCSIAALTDPAAYGDVRGYAELSEVKLNPEKGGDGTNVQHLSMTQLALAMGAEVIAGNRSARGLQAKMLAAQGRAVAGYPTEDDIALLRAHANCSNSAGLWSSFAAASEPSLARRAEVALSPQLLGMANQWPPVLQALVIKRLAIHAGEIGDFVTAERLSTHLLPDSRYGDLPKIHDGSLLYLFALVRQGRDDVRFVQVLKYLGERDGLYRSRALARLVQDSETSTRDLPEHFSSYLSEVESLYTGQSESRAASLQVVKFRAEAARFVDGIKQAKRQFANYAEEMNAAVDMLGHALSENMSHADVLPRLYALNGYFYDSDFFANFSESESLKVLALKTALDLGLPELATQIEIDNLQLMALAKASKMMKLNKFNETLDILEPYKDAQIAQNLRVAAAIETGVSKTLNNTLNDVAESERRDDSYVEFALRNGLWSEALDVVHMQTSKADFEKNTTLKTREFSLGILEYLSSPALPETPGELSDKTTDLKVMLQKLQANTETAKRYLDEG